MTSQNDNTIDNAATLLKQGGLVAMPTETVYGLAADATNNLAVARIFEAKGRPQFNPLIVHVTDATMAERYVTFPPLAQKLSQAFWPGALTLVLPRRTDSSVSHLVSAGLDTLGVRSPDHQIAQSLLRTVDRPLAAPSANISGTISPTRADHVEASLGDKVDLILDGGACPVGVESTIIKVDGSEATLLRPGGVAVEDIERCIGKPVLHISDTARLEAPGMLASHYAPNAPVRLNAHAPKPDEAFLAFGQPALKHPYTLNLSPKGDLREAAANLFTHLRALDDLCKTQGLAGIAAASIPAAKLGLAINDRLQRAAAPRN